MNIKKEVAIAMFLISFAVMLISLNLLLGIYWLIETRELFNNIILPTITFMLSFAGLLYGIYLYRRD